MPTNNPSPAIETRRVVTSFLEHAGKILILRRSSKMKTMAGRWAGVSGYLEGDEDPYTRAVEEIKEEVCLENGDIELVSRGRIIAAQDVNFDHVFWIVHPFLFRAKIPKIELNWENEEYRWIDPKEISSYETVPNLKWTLERVLKLESPKLGESTRRHIQAIRDDKTHGASWLSRESILTLKRAAESDLGVANPSDYLLSVGRELLDTRPSMAPLQNLLTAVISKISTMDSTDVTVSKDAVGSEVDQLIEDSLRAQAVVAENVASLLVPGSTVLTHSYSATVAGALKAAHKQRKNISVIVTESRPRYEGKTLAEELARARIPVTLITDSEAGHFAKIVDSVLFGADMVLADGSAVNKIGTSLIAMAAYNASKPVIFACEKFKFSVGSYLGEETVLEEKGPEELGRVGSGVKVRNIYFDITDARYISTIVTEDGSVSPAEVARHIEKLLMKLKVV